MSDERELLEGDSQLGEGGPQRGELQRGELEEKDEGEDFEGHQLEPPGMLDDGSGVIEVSQLEEI